MGPNETENGLILRYKEDKDQFFNYFVNVTKRFEGAVIHDYEGWYQDLYCEKPESNSSYYYGTPKDC